MGNKIFKIPARELIQIIKSEISCIASDKITVDGEKVNYMYRGEPEATFDSGWRFFSGNETQEYTDDESHFAFYKINTILNYDIDILPYLQLPIGTNLEREAGDRLFKLITENQSDEVNPV